MGEGDFPAGPQEGGTGHLGRAGPDGFGAVRGQEVEVGAALAGGDRDIDAGREGTGAGADDRLAAVLHPVGHFLPGGGRLRREAAVALGADVGEQVAAPGAEADEFLDDFRRAVPAVFLGVGPLAGGPAGFAGLEPALEALVGQLAFGIAVVPSPAVAAVDDDAGLEAADFGVRDLALAAVEPDEVDDAVVREQLGDLAGDQGLALRVVVGGFLWQGARLVVHAEHRAAHGEGLVVAVKPPIGRRVVEADLQAVLAAGGGELLHKIAAAEELRGAEIAVGGGPEGEAVVVLGNHDRVGEAGGLREGELGVVIDVVRFPLLRPAVVGVGRDRAVLPRLVGEHAPGQVAGGADRGEAPVDEEAEAGIGEPLGVRVLVRSGGLLRRLFEGGGLGVRGGVGEGGGGAA